MALTRSAPERRHCWAVASSGGMLSPGWAKSAARKVSWKSSSRTAVPLAQAAHSAATLLAGPRPSTVAPPGLGWARAWARAAAGGSRSRAGTATATSTGTGSAASSASRQASSRSRGNRSPGRWTRTSWSRMGLPYPVMKLADRMRLLGTESAFEVLARARALEAAGVDVVHLEIGEPDADTPAHIVAAAQEGLARGLTHYVPAPGTLELRTAVAAFLERTGRLRTSPDQVVVTPGAKPIMFFTILALCQPGDEVLYPDPGFPMYESIAAFAGARPVPVPLREANRFRMDPAELASLVTDRTRLVILNSPHNPCGSGLTQDDVEAIAAVALERDLVVLSDEVYWAIRYGGGRAR